MRLFSSFRNKEQARIEHLYHEAQLDTERQYAPVRDLCVAIATAAEHCRDQTKKYITMADEKARTRQEIFMFFEHVFFFTYLAMSDARDQLSKEQMRKVAEYVVSVVPSASIDAYCAHWPDRLRDGMTKEFIENLTTSDAEFGAAFANSTATSPEDRLLDLFEYHALHIAQLCGREGDWGQIKVPLLDLLSDEWNSAQFGNCVLRISQQTREEKSLP